MKKERKSNLFTIRITDDEMGALDRMCDISGKSKSDILFRACKFFLNTDDVITEEEKKDKTRKTHQVHLRMSDSDAKEVYGRSEKLDATASQIIRKSIKRFERFTRNDY